MKSRLVVLLIAVCCLWTLMIGRAAFLQLLPNTRLKALQKRQFETMVTLNSRRGDVVDRKGRELAVSTTAYSLFADPKVIANPQQVAAELSKILGTSKSELMKKLKFHHSRFVWIERRMEIPQHDAIDALKVHGLGFIEESRRVYPNERLLSQVLGFVGSDGKGLEGLESELNEPLEGIRKKVSMQRDAHGRPLIVNGQVFNESPDGSDVQLTIDRELQFMLEQELRAAVVEHDADNAVAVILDAKTSEVLAMASSGSFDSNNAASAAPALRRNRPVTDAFEPGSTMKTFTIAAALKAGVLEPNTKYNCEGGKMKIGSHTIHEAETKDKFEWLTASEILAHSSNVGASKIAFSVGPEKVRQMLLDFGFNAKTGVDLPGEAKGVLHPLPWGDLQFANISFGQGVMATPLQIANAYAAIANGGVLKRPYIVKSIYDHETNEKTETTEKVVGRILTPEQASKLRLMLMGPVAKDGTGYAARVPGYPVAGKTGTAQRVNPNGGGYVGGGFIASFAGFLPANDPKFVIYVAVEHPRKDHFGGAAAAPVFSRIAKFAVRQFDLAPVLITEDNIIRKTIDPVLAAQLTLKPSAAVTAAMSIATNGQPQPLAKAAMASLPQRVAAAAPAVVVNANTTVVAAPVLSAMTAAGEIVVPDLSGLSLREVLNRIGPQGPNVTVHGQGFVTQTIPGAGARLATGRPLTVILTHK